jgi:nucleoside-diphosphate-sugar epimerase
LESLIVFGNPDIRRDFVYVDDLVEATARAGLLAPPGIYNVGSGQATPLREIISLLLAQVDDEADVVHADPRPVDVPRTQLDYSRIEETIGWRPSVSLHDGIGASWEWVRSRPAASLAADLRSLAEIDR